MANEIKQKYDITSKLIEGSGGVFDVVVDGQLIFSKHQTGRFPEHGEILAKLGELAA